MSRTGVALRPSTLWITAWALWLASAALMPVPPWRAAGVLAREEAAARRLASDPAFVPLWSVDLGRMVQQQALGPGWGPVAGRDTGRHRRTVLSSADLRFDSPAWPEAHLTIAAGPLENGATAHVAVRVDGAARGTLDLEGAGTVRSIPLAALAAGVHRLTLEIEPVGSPIAGVAVGTAPVADPARDTGFVQWVAVGAHERPALFPSAEGAPAPEGAADVEWKGQHGWYAFGIGPPVGTLATAVEILNGLAAAALMAVVTGLGYAALFVPSGPARLALAPLLSFGALAVVFAALRLLGVTPTAGATALGLAIAGALPLARRRQEGPALVPWTAMGSATLALLALVGFALRVVPPLDDQDLEVQATASGLARNGTPATVTDRGTTRFFAHPPLLHVFVAGSFALSGRLDRMSGAEALAERARARGPFVEPTPDEYPPRYYDLWQELLRRFFTEPQLWPTRQVNVLLAAIVVGWLAEVAAAVSGHAAAGVAAALVMASFPEFLIRGSYGGYFAVATFTTVALLALFEARPGWTVAAASALAALSDQKGLLAPVAWLAVAPSGSGYRRFVPAAGAALGLLLFAAWGLAVDAPTFVYDFVKVHVASRLALHDVRMAHDSAIWYPSIPELWGEFVARYGIVFTLAAAGASLLALRSDSPRVRACGASVLVGALVFSLTDWRQTKHLALLVAPALLALAAAGPARPRARLAFLALLGAMVVSNLVTAWPLLRDFTSLTPSTIW
jgi:hypothetical protein